MGRWSRARPRPPPASAEDRLELIRGRGLELVVPTIRRRLVRAPALERRPVAEAVALEMVVRHLGHPLGAERLPGQVLAAVPARRRSGESLAGRIRLTSGGPLRPFLPGV